MTRVVWIVVSVCAGAIAMDAIPHSSRPPREYRGVEFELTIDNAILTAYMKTPGLFGGDRGTNPYVELSPGCQCGTHVPKGSRLKILKIHHGPNGEEAIIRFTVGPDTTRDFWATWWELQQDIKPVSTR